MGKGPTSRQLFAGEAIAVKSRDISDAARGANYLPDLGSRRSAMVPRGVASTSWGAHRMKQADGGGRPEPPERDRKSVV